VQQKKCKREYHGYKDLKVYQLAYKLAMEIFELSKSFPKEEKYSLTDQIVRSSRSVPANIVEGWMKRLYVKMFISKMNDSLGESGETEVWLNFSLDCGYITKEKHQYFVYGYAEVNRMLFGMIMRPDRFILRMK
jgi:four helix bundle protein